MPLSSKRRWQVFVCPDTYTPQLGEEARLNEDLQEVGRLADELKEQEAYVHVTQWGVCQSLSDVTWDDES